MRHYALALLLGLCLVSTVRADEASHRKTVLQLFDVLDMNRIMNASMETALQVQLQANPSVAPYQDVLRKFFTKYMSWASLKDAIADLYMKTFREDELKQIVAFYKTPAGKKTITELPTLMQQGAQIAARRMEEHSGELEGMLREAQAKKGGAK